MSDFALTILLIGALFGGLTALGLVLHLIFDRLTGHAHKSTAIAAPKLDSALGTSEVQVTNTPAVSTPTAASSDGQAAYAARLKALGVTIEMGDELRMGWFEMIFKLAPAIAGIDEVWTLHGSADFTDGDRCLVIFDGLRLVILDRRNNHGLRLELSKGWFDCSVMGSSVRIRYHRFHGRENVEKEFTIDAHASDREILIPADWPGTAKLLPAAAETTN